MRLLITGLNHRTAPVELRERLAFSESALPEALKALRERPELSEFMILSTCNRVEIAVTSEEARDPRDPVELFLRESRGVAEADLSGHLYRYEGSEAIRHIFRVAASLDSMVIGEPQILGQLKAAYAVAKAHGSVNGFLETVLTKAFAVAKRVRNETEIGQSAVSISYAAVELAREIFGSLATSNVLLIGAGKMSELAARHLQRSGAPKIFVTNRTRSRADRGTFGFDIRTGATAALGIKVVTLAAVGRGVAAAGRAGKVFGGGGGLGRDPPIAAATPTSRAASGRANRVMVLKWFPLLRGSQPAGGARPHRPWPLPQRCARGTGRGKET